MPCGSDAGDVQRQYDRGHGGPERARAAATAVETLLDAHLDRDRRVLDLAAGPGSVARHLTGTVVTLDCCAEFVAACPRGRAVRADATASLPVADAALDAVISVFWLHMAPATGVVLAEISRVLRPGGVFVTTSDKLAVDELVRGTPSYRPWRGDTAARLVNAGRRVGLSLVGATSFLSVGHPEPARHATYPVLGFTRLDPR